MKVDRVEGSKARRILIGMIVDRSVVARIAPMWNKEGLFASKWENLVAGWCVKFFQKHDKAPLASIEGMFESWSSNAKDEESIRLAGKLLSELNGEYGRFRKSSNPDHVIDMAAEYFEVVRLKRLQEQIEGDLDLGKLEQARKRVEEYNKQPLELGETSFVDVYNDREALNRAFAASQEQIVTYPEALGEFFRHSFHREAFVCWMAPEKVGKSWWLQDLAVRSMEQERNVAFFAIGDLSESDMMLRFAVRAARRPEHPSLIRIPTYIEPDSDSEVRYRVDFTEKNYLEGLTSDQAWNAFQKINSVRGGRMRLSVHPNFSIGVTGISSILDSWERRDGWIPDIIAIDYADLLIPMPGYSESRDGVNANWKVMRGMAQSRRCLVATVTQVKAEAYDVELMSRKHFAEDHRKLAHVTDMIAINQKAKEKPLGIQRLNHIVFRKSYFSETDYVVVAGCLGLANPAVKSIFP